MIDVLRYMGHRLAGHKVQRWFPYPHVSKTLVYHCLKCHIGWFFIDRKER